MTNLNEKLTNHILTLEEFSSNDINSILDLADLLKNEKKNGIRKKLLDGKSLALILQSPSTRTRVSFEVGMSELGGNAITLDKGFLQKIGNITFEVRGETIEDTSKVLSSYVDIIGTRFSSHDDLIRFSNFSSVPVINCQSNLYHPCQTLADLQTLREEKKTLKGLNVSWVGDGTNVCNSLLIGCSKMGININLSIPKKYRQIDSVFNAALKFAQESGSEISFVDDPIESVKNADAIFTDTFVSVGLESEREKRLSDFIPKYQINQNLINNSKNDVIFLHCLPAHRGEEVTDDIIDGPHSRVWNEAENRLHVQKALLCHFLLND